MARKGTSASPEKADYEKFKKSKLGKKVRKTEKQLPKCPMSAFLKFQAVERGTNDHLYRDMSITQASKAIAAKWRQLKPEFKASLISEYKREKKEFAKAKQSLKVIELKGKKNNPPKRQVHQPFVAFIKSEYGEVKRGSSGLTHTQIIKTLSRRWHQLTEEQKLGYKLQLLTN